MESIIREKIKIAYFGHSAFRIESSEGKVILIDPWLDNPISPKDKIENGNVDIILITHGHQDHIGNTIEVCSKKDAKVIAIYEIVHYLGGKGIKNLLGMNIGWTIKEGDVFITMVPASHSSSIDDNGKLIYAGEATGYVIKLESGFTVYHAGDTGVFQDMNLVREIYRPDLAFLPIGGLYVMSPLEAVFACRLIQPKFVIPMHYGTLAGLTGKPEEFKELMKTIPNITVIEMKPGNTLP